MSQAAVQTTTDFINPRNVKSGIQVGDQVLHDHDCFQLPNDNNIYKGIFSYQTQHGLNPQYVFTGMQLKKYNQGEWTTGETLRPNMVVQRLLQGFEVVPCPLDLHKASNAYPVLRTLNAVSRRGTVQDISGLLPELQGTIESYLTGVNPNRPPRETRLRMREIITRPNPGFYGTGHSGVGGRKRRTKTRQRRAKKRSQTRRRR